MEAAAGCKCTEPDSSSLIFSFVHFLCCCKERCQANDVEEAPSLHRRAMCSKLARSTAASPFCFFLAESIWTVDVQRTELSRLEMVQRQLKPPGVPEELFSVLQEMQKNLIYFEGNEEKREALALLHFEQCHRLFDDLLQKTSGALSQTDQGNSRPSAVPTLKKSKFAMLKSLKC